MAYKKNDNVILQKLKAAMVATIFTLRLDMLCFGSM